MGRGSFKVNLRTGLWSDFSQDGRDLIAPAAYLFSLPQDEAAQASMRWSALIPMSDDPFTPLGKPAKPRWRVVASASDLAIVAPIPADAPAMPTHPLGAPAATWIYRDAEGRDLGRALRFDRDGQKEFRPLTLWRKGSAAPTWRWALWPELRPLYGLDRLAKRLSAPIIVTEGEKAADAAQRLLPVFVAVNRPAGRRPPASRLEPSGGPPRDRVARC